MSDSPRFLSPDLLLSEAMAAALTEALGETVTVCTDPRLERRAINALTVQTLASAWQLAKGEWRDLDAEEREVDIGIVGPAEPSDERTLDAGLAKCAAVRALWQKGGALREASIAGHVWTGRLTQSPLFDQHLYQTQKLFVAVITVGLTNTAADS